MTESCLSNTVPWLTLIGLHEDGLPGLNATALQALADADVVFGAPRHLALAHISANAPASRARPWPVPFDVAPLLALRGRQRVVALASGDPFWHGVGGTLAAHLQPHEWRCLPQNAAFSLLAARLGWRLESAHCLALHADSLQRLLPQLAPGQRVMALLRDGAAAQALAQWLGDNGWGASPFWLGQALGSTPHSAERCRHWPSADAAAQALPAAPAQAPVLAAFEAQGGTPLPSVPGRAEHWFAHDGQISKSPVRALTLAALAPYAGAHLWDIGGGSGAVSVEWCLAGGTATCIEQHAARAANIAQNTARFGLSPHLHLQQGQALAVLQTRDLPTPQAVFVGGGFEADLFNWLHAHLPPDCRLVVNAVTLQTQALLQQLHTAHGGQLLKLDWAQAQPLGPAARFHGWQAARTLLQWSWQR